MGCGNSKKEQPKTKQDPRLNVKQNGMTNGSKKRGDSEIMEAKIVLLGDSGVGKSSIANRYCKN